MKRNVYVMNFQDGEAYVRYFRVFSKRHSYNQMPYVSVGLSIICRMRSMQERFAFALCSAV